MSTLDSRNTQTIVKHEILEEYLKRWNGIITYGLKPTYEQRARRGQSFNVKFVYVDCFSFMGRYASSKGGDWVAGSPLIGISALDTAKDYAIQHIGFRPEINVILFEQESPNYTALLKTLEVSGYSSRARQMPDIASLRNGEIAVFNTDYREHIDEVLNFTGRDYTWAFYLLDPYGPKGMELDVVGRVISQDKNDVMINFPYLDLQKRTGSVIKETPEHIHHLQYWDEMYGSDDWRTIVRTTNNSDDLETALVQHYADRLRSCDPGLAIKSIPLRFKDKERTMFYLFLTTHDPTGGLAMNDILHSAKQDEHEYRVQWKNEQFRERSGGYVQPSLFGDIESESIAPPRPSKETIAERIYSLCRGETIEYREVLRRVIDETYFPQEIESAMRLLKKQERAEFSQSKPRNQDVIRFR